MSSRVKDAIRQMQLPGASVPICLRADLVAEHEAAVRELEQVAQQSEDSLSGDPRRLELADRIEQLRQQMLDHNATFVLRGMERRKFRRFVAAHPPRRDPDDPDNDEKVHPRDRFAGVNAETFYPALIRSSTVEVRMPGDETGTVLDDEDWRILLGDTDEEKERLEAAGRADEVQEGRLTDAQFGALAEAAWMLNRGEVDIPFSLAASKIHQSSGSG